MTSCKVYFFLFRIAALYTSHLYTKMDLFHGRDARILDDDNAKKRHGPDGGRVADLTRTGLNAVIQQPLISVIKALPSTVRKSLMSAMKDGALSYGARQMNLLNSQSEMLLRRIKQNETTHTEIVKRQREDLKACQMKLEKLLEE